METTLEISSSLRRFSADAAANVPLPGSGYTAVRFRSLADLGRTLTDLDSGSTRPVSQHVGSAGLPGSRIVREEPGYFGPRAIIRSNRTCRHSTGVDGCRPFETERMSHGAQVVAHASQIVGDIARGALITLIGIYAMSAAVTDDPMHVKSLDQVLKTFAHEAHGTWLIGIAALGLLAFSVSSIFEVAYRRL
jgi:hypothetical protein